MNGTPTKIPHQYRRKTVLINPRLQVGVAFGFGGVVLAGAALFAWRVYVEAGAALKDLAYQAHFKTGMSPYDVVRDVLVRNVGYLLAGITVVSILLFAFFVYRVRKGVGRVVESVNRSVDGDLTTLTRAGGIKDVEIFGRQVDAIRGHVYGIVVEARGHIKAVRDGNLPADENERRWKALKETIGRIAP